MNLNKLSIERLKAYIQSHGKVVNQRIKVLETTGNVKTSAYRYVSDNLPLNYKNKSASGHLKIDIKTRGKSRNELLELANIIHNFESAKTSTISGIKKTNKRIKEETEKSLGVKISQQDFDSLFSSIAFKKFIDSFDSNQFKRFVKTYGFEDTQKVIIEAFKKNLQTLSDIEALFTGGKFKKFNEDDYIF